MKSGAASRRSRIPLDFILVFLLAAALIWPLFKVKYVDKWASIESTFIADARFLKEHWPHPSWQPLWYGGTRFDYIYPPALRYGTAALAKYYPMTEARAYHIYTAFFYCIGIAGVFLFVRIACGSRGAAWLAAAAAALLSPTFLFVPAWRNDSWLHHPTRLGVLVRYGEGPHMTAFALLPIVLAACFLAFRAWRPVWTAVAAVCCALVVSHNFYGAVALAICFPILLWSVWITHLDRGILMRALAIPALAYGLTAFWLTPSYLSVTTSNLKLVAQAGNTWSICVALATLGLYAFVTVRWARGKPERSYPIFAAGFALFFSLNVLGNQFFGFRIAGEPSRLMPEVDLALILLMVEALRRLWLRGAARKVVAVAVALVSLATAVPYVLRAWRIITPDPNYQDRVEYKLPEWMADHLPNARTMATGSVRFWYDAWRDLPQMAGGSDQGVINQLINLAYLQIANAPEIEPSIHWMQSFGVDAIIVHDKQSQEIYHDYLIPQKFAKLEVLFDNHQGDIIYRVPRRFPDLARVVETSRVRWLPQAGLEADSATVRAYAEALEHGPDTRAPMSWEGVDSIRIQADVETGQSVIAQVSHDPQWRAESDGTRLTIRRDALGQMLIETPPGRQTIRLVFEPPLENRVGKAISLVCIAIVIALVTGKGRFVQRIAIPTNIALVAGLFALNVALNIPLFQPGEMPYRDSIEGGYAAAARFFSAHPNPWGWNPTQYGGLPAQFTYMPGLPYLAAALSHLAPSFPPDYAYRIIASTFACFGPASLFVFVFYFTRSRSWALAAALAYTFFSPLYFLVHTIDLDRGKAYLPWRLQALLKYGEGPHNAGLTLLPPAIVAVWRAGLSQGFPKIFPAALLLAAVTLMNWVAALALAVCCLTLLLTLAGSTDFRAVRVLAAAAVGYGLACFWLTPSFIRTIAFNWPIDAFDYHLRWPQVLLLAGIPAVALLLHFLLVTRFPDQHYFRFAVLTFAVFAWVVLWFYSIGVDTIPESRRYAVEMEFFLVVALVEILRLAMRSRLRFAARAVAFAAVLAGSTQFWKYCTQGFAVRRPAPADSTIEYRIAEKLAALHPQGRVFASGGLRFRLNSWFELAQVGGGFESGLTTRMPLNLSYQVRTGVNSAPEREGADAVRELKTLGVEYAVVHGPKSREHYRDFKNPRKFEGLLETVWREEDDTIYRVPFTSLAHLVGRKELSVWHPLVLLPPTDPYSLAIDDSSRPKLAFAWSGPNELHVRGPILAGQLVSVQVNYDTGWRAEQDGQSIPIERDGLGYLLLRAKASPTAHIRLRYTGTVEQRAMAALSALVWMAALGKIILWPRMNHTWRPPEMNENS